MKIALLFPQPVYLSLEGGSNTIKKLEVLFSKAGMDSVIFSLGHNNKVIKEKYYTEYVIKSPVYLNDGNWLYVFLDHLSMLLANQKISDFIYNHNKKLVKNIATFDPNLIISSGQYFNKLLEVYKTLNKNVKIITSTDDIRGLELTFDLIEKSYRNGGLKGILFGPIVRNITKKYLSYYKKLYDYCIVNYDAITYVSKEDFNAAALREVNKKYKSKFYVIPPPKDSEKYKTKIRKKAHKILFIGNCIGNRASFDASETIVKAIAPNVPFAEFILTGKGCKKFSSSNVSSLGFVKNFKRVVEDADICLAPIKVGSGLKTKILTYFSAGKPIIGTHVAFEGFSVKNGINCLIEDDLSKYPKIINRLLTNYNLRKRLSNNALKVSDQFSEKTILNLWVHLFKKLVR
ncbi:MAG: glycosyltransferase [Candidatus Micrarchaeaceae archaeon]